MKKTIDELLETTYWIIDILPMQVRKGSPGQYFAIERYLMEGPRRSAIRQKHISMILKLNCYRDISLNEEQTADPVPERIAEEMREKHVCIMVDDAMFVSDPDDTYMTLYHPDAELLELVRILAEGEGLYVWQPADGR